MQWCLFKKRRWADPTGGVLWKNLYVKISEEEEASRGSSSRSSDGASNAKRKHVPKPESRKKSRGQTESLLTEMKETMNTLKTLASDTFSKEILEFLKEEIQRQTTRDDAFLKIMGALVQQPHPVVTSPVISPMSEPRKQFWYGMTNIGPCSSLVSHEGCIPQDLSGSQGLNVIYAADE